MFRKFLQRMLHEQKMKLVTVTILMAAVALESKNLDVTQIQQQVKLLEKHSRS